MYKTIKIFLGSMLILLTIGGCSALPKECLDICKQQHLKCESEAKRTNERCMLEATTEQKQSICNDSFMDSRFECTSAEPICRSSCF